MQETRAFLPNMASWLLLYFVSTSLSLFSFPICRSSSVPASFVFGDSLVDSGNNNFIFSLSKANNLHNGLDFAPTGGRPTGRYTNGRTIPDMIGEELNLTSFAPPYLDPSTHGAAILQGVNYGSGGGGILNETGRLFIGRIALDRQIFYFENTKSELIDILGEEEAANYLARSIFSITIGANDYLNNYETPIPSSGDSRLSAEDFQQLLISRFRDQLTRLYDLGARKIIVAAIAPIGCTPYQRSLRVKIGGDCAESPNRLVVSYNRLLRNLIIELNGQLPGVRMIYANAYDIVADLINNYVDYGFEEARTACCGTGGLYKGLIPCTARASVCPDRSKYIFWDPYHPTEAAYSHIARRFMHGDQNDAFPINIRQLVDL